MMCGVFLALSPRVPTVSIYLECFTQVFVLAFLVVAIFYHFRSKAGAYQAQNGGDGAHGYRSIVIA